MMLSLNRLGEVGNAPMRSDRFFNADNLWYFSTREGTPIGPYQDKAQASAGLFDFIEFLRLANPKVLTSFFNSLTNANKA